MQNTVSVFLNSTLIQPGRLTDNVFEFRAVTWGSMYKRREHLTHLRAVLYNQCLVLLIYLWSSVVIELTEKCIIMAVVSFKGAFVTGSS